MYNLEMIAYSMHYWKWYIYSSKNLSTRIIVRCTLYYSPLKIGHIDMICTLLNQYLTVKY